MSESGAAQPPRAPLRLSWLPPPNRAKPTARANSGLDKPSGKDGAPGQEDGKDASGSLPRSSDRASPQQDPTVSAENALQFSFPSRYGIARRQERRSALQENDIEHQLTKINHPWTPDRAHEPHDQGSDGPTLSLRSTRSARSWPCRLYQRLQLRSAAPDPDGPHALRIHL